MKDWYVAIQHKMPTTAPDLGSCGTTYPVWLNGNKLNTLDVSMLAHGIYNIGISRNHQNKKKYLSLD